MNLKQKGLYALVAAQMFSGAAFASAKISADKDTWLSVGVGVRGSYSAVENAAPNGKSWSNDFNLDNARIYLNGQINKYIGFELNTECIFCSNSSLQDYRILDAIMKINLDPKFNIWAGRLLVPSDRAEMSGPFYANTYEFNKTPFYPSDYSTKFGNGGAGVYGRDQGVTFWGGLGDKRRFTYAVGVFNGYQGGPNQSDSPLFGARVSYNFLNVEKNPGYYTSSTYYGKAGDIFTIGLAAQHQNNGAGTKTDPADFDGYSADMLFEKVLGNKGVATVEGEYKVFNTSLDSAALASSNCFCMFSGNAWTGTALYLFPEKVGIGKFQPYMRYTSVSPDNSSSREETEAGVNYIIKGHNARISLMYEYGDIATKGLNYSTANLQGKKVSAVKLGFQYQY